MSLYFQTKVRGDGKPIPDLLQAHPISALAATGWSGNKVTVSGEDGAIMSVISRNTQPTALAWHPTASVLVVGWRDGALTLWSQEEPSSPSHTSTSAHDSLAVVSATWSTNGAFLLTSSKSGAIVAWQTERVAAAAPAANSTGGAASPTKKAAGVSATSAVAGTMKLASIYTVKGDLPALRAVHLNSVQKSKVAPSPVGAAQSSISDDEFVFALSTGGHSIGIVDDGQQVSQLIAVERDQTIVGILWDAERRNLVSLSSTMMIAVHHVDLDFKATTTLRRKISAPNRAVASSDGTASADAAVPPKMIWAAPGVVGLCCGDDKIRLFSIEAEVIYLLTPDLPAITCISASLSRKLLVCGTSDGRAGVYRFNGKANSQDADDWTLVSQTSDVGRPVDSIRLLSSGDMIYTQDGVSVTLQESQRKRKWTGNASAFQVEVDHVLVETSSGSKCLVKIPSHVRALDLCYPQLAVYTGSSIAFYSIAETTGTASALNTTDASNSCFALHPEGLLRAREMRISFENFQNQPISGNGLTFTESEGAPVVMDLQGDFIVVATSKKMLKIARIANREIRSVGPARPVLTQEADVSISSVAINGSGKRVALTTTVGGNKIPDSRVWVFDVETDRMMHYDFAASNAIPVYVTWNKPAPNTNNVGELEHLLLTCETKSMSVSRRQAADGAASSHNSPARGVPPQAATDPSNNASPSGGDIDESRVDDDDATLNQVVTLFATPNSVVVHHTVPLKSNQSFIGSTVPNLWIETGSAAAGGVSPFALESRRLRDFEGLSGEGDPTVRDALMRFGFHTTIGNMDEAYRAVKTIKDPSVWQNLAKMCVKSKRLDVAEVCLANMQDGVAARALREARDEPEVDTRVGVLAAALGLRDEAERLFRRSKRYDLITELHIACGNWDAATKNTELADRIRLRQVSYRYAQWMESTGDFNAAVTNYQRAGCGGTDVPRLYFLHQRLDELKALVADVKKEDVTTTAASEMKSNGNQRELVMWWAQYQERSGNISEALKCYELVEDVYHTVRLLTMQTPPDINRAQNLVLAAPPKQQGAAYFIGLYYEQQNNVSKALQFYAIAGATRRAIQLAKTNDLHGEIVGIVLKSEDKQLALECASWFEGRGALEKAAQLFQKGGDVQRAIDVSIKGGLYDVLNQISESLDQAADPETFIQMAEHFLHSSHFDKAAQMLIFAKAYNEALQLCVDKNVKLTDEMAEAMTLPKAENDEDEAYRVSLLKKIAKVAKEQESWHLACRKYTQAGERVKAMKMLLRAGDTEKVMFFANHSRNNEIYVLAGNYLQSQDWQHDANIYKNIVQFYTKAKAFENLASFYDACSQLQIDEYRNYDNALVTLREALKALEKGDASVTKRDHFSSRITVVESFVNARRMIQPGKPCVEMVQICTDLISRSRADHPDHDIIEASIRVGDVYALLVEYYDKLVQVENAYSLMDRMRQQGIELTFFLEQQLVERICRAVGRDPTIMLASSTAANANGRQPAAPNGGADVDDDVFQEEEV